MNVLNVEPERYDPALRDHLARAGSIDYVECADRAAFLAALSRRQYQALFVRLGLEVDAEVFDAARDLRFVVTPTTGLDHLDLKEAERRGIRVLSLRGEVALLEHVHSTAEHAFALLLALVRRLPAAARDASEGRWRREPFLATELFGKKLGVIGAGRLGRKVLRFGLAFGMETFAFDRDPSALASSPEGTRSASLDDLLAQSDVVSLHLSLDASTEGFLSRDRIAKLKPGAILINTARGELVDEGALLEALEKRRLGGAGLDVLAGDSGWSERGPLRPHPLLEYARTHDNLIITPHVGGYAKEAISKTRRFIVERFLSALEEEAP